AGTGSFLDQQAHRLGLAIEGEFGRLALQSKNPPRIAGRCSVFAKSDMIHLQQVATPDYDIVAALCYAVARNFKSCIAKGKRIRKPISFLGGVAANQGMVAAFEDILELAQGELLVPLHHASMGAIGAALVAGEEAAFWERGAEEWGARIRLLESRREEEYPAYDALSPPRGKSGCDQGAFSLFPRSPSTQIPAYLGVDVGSISTNVVLLDEQGRLLARRYLMTAGRPIDAVRRGILEVGQEVGDRVKVVGATTTGSGRYMIADFIGADLVKNEITAQARAAVELDPRVDTIFEIGGQDSKYISLQNGVVVDFEMNKVCAAGTGSFLEEQAEKLNLRIEEQFGRVAFSASRPARLGERCTVFMESDLTNLLQKGVKQEDLVAGLSYSIVHNYLNKVVGDRRIGDHIFFQGGVAANQAVVAAFEKVMQKEVTVPPHHDVTGAIGAALLARDGGITSSHFKGFDLAKRQYSLDSFRCHACPNQCEINRVTLEGEPPLYYGSRCDRYEIGRRDKPSSSLPDLFAERELLFLSSDDSTAPDPASGALRVGFPRALLSFYDLYPFWRAFFGELGLELVLSDPTNKAILHESVEDVAAETCFPVKVAHGHVLNLLNKGVDLLFLPSIIDLPPLDPQMERAFACPYVQTLPYVIESSLSLRERGVRLLSPSLHFRQGPKSLRDSLLPMGRFLQHKESEMSRAIDAGYDAWDRFQGRVRKRGQEVLQGLREEETALVVLSRSYNGHDREINLNLPAKLRDLGVLALPMDFLPETGFRVSREFPQMYWHYGQRILQAAEIISRDPRLFPVYITNFACGPDSFISHFLKEKLGGKPFLQLEIDEHSADAGIITRCEAFLDSIKNASRRRSVSVPQPRSLPVDLSSRTIYIPYMADHAFMIQAALAQRGLRSEVLPETDMESVHLGRKYTSGRECFPCIVTLGDILKKLYQPDVDPAASAFFMPSADGPCRFGQYATFQAKVLQELGFGEVAFISPGSEDSYGMMGSSLLGTSFRRNAWRGIVAVDLLEKMYREARPYEVNPGEAERTYRLALEDIYQAIARGEDPRSALLRSKEAFSRLKRWPDLRKPVVGVVGEIFLRAHRFSNNHLVRRIEELGGEVWLAPMMEWIFYTNALCKQRARQRGRWGEFFLVWLQDLVQKWDEHRLASCLHGLLNNGEEPATEALLKWAQPYLDPSHQGEAILSIGKSIDYLRKGASGLIAVMPFTCMPGTVVTAISKRLREDWQGIPFLSLAYDGLDEVHTQTRLEAFMYQVRGDGSRPRR
ncbi:MAG: acyl-CoA dehydratase activase, partial [candidate division NC10 bacterium]|nr:acyl-CoA dehydratase activase [candidate division NC10 bacterium]